MNAIERLREYIHRSVVIASTEHSPTDSDARDALAAVETLYQAAKEAANPMTPDGRAAPFMWDPANRALAAAVRQVEA